MKDIECPYCGHEQDICHDDGFGYAHKLLPTQRFPLRFSVMACSTCEFERRMTDEEFKKYWPNEER